MIMLGMWFIFLSSLMSCDALTFYYVSQSVIAQCHTSTIYCMSDNNAITSIKSSTQKVQRTEDGGFGNKSNVYKVSPARLQVSSQHVGKSLVVT